MDVESMALKVHVPVQCICESFGEALWEVRARLQGRAVQHSMLWAFAADPASLREARRELGDHAYLGVAIW